MFQDIQEVFLVTVFFSLTKSLWQCLLLSMLNKIKLYRKLIFKKNESQLIEKGDKPYNKAWMVIWYRVVDS